MIGKLLGNRYEVIEAISASPIFESYAAKDRYKGDDVCVRVLNPPFSAEPEFVAALRTVVEQTSSLDHPNVAKVYGIGDHDGRPFVICELIRGSNLVERIRRVAPFSPPVACELAIGICEALSHAADHDLAHGDLCSDHVLATMEGRVAVLDFGLWKCYSKSPTAGGMVLSRMAPYMAPEVIDGGMPDAASDVYAVGVILFELLTGRLPFSGQTPGAILAKHTTLEAPKPRSVNAAVPVVLDEITFKCLEKNPRARYQSFSHLLSDLKQTRDAMRFGRQLAWPINPPVEAKPEAAASTLPWASSGHAPKGATSPPTVEPKAKPVRPERPPKPVRAKRVRPPKPIRDPADDDVPMWFRSVVYLLAGTALAFVLGWMYMNATKRREIQLPNLVGMTVAEARQRAETSGFILEVTDEVYNEDFPQPDTIVRMNPDARTPVREGARVRVVRSLGTRNTEVPDLEGLSVEEARRRLQAAGLTVGEISEVASDEVEFGFLVRTDPPAGRELRREATVDLIVSGEQPPELRPNEQPNTWTLRFQVRETDEPVMVKVEMTDASRRPRVIFEEARMGGDYVEMTDIEGVGKTATFRIYFDDRLFRTVRRDGND